MIVDMNFLKSKTPLHNVSTISSSYIKHVNCPNCKQLFNVRGGRNNRRTSRLLKCGHCICESCIALPSVKTCPTCQTTIDKHDKGTNFSVNIWVTGLIETSQVFVAQNIEPNLGFQQPAALQLQESATDNPEQCSECGVRAESRCRQCEVFFCSTCYRKIHGRALQNHQNISLEIYDSNFAKISSGKCEIHPHEIAGHYCKQCDIFACPMCMLHSHHGHLLTTRAEKNEELKPRLEYGMVKLSETLERMKIVEKKLKSHDLFEQEISNIEAAEAAISQNFVHLHGMLQCLEERLVSRLQEQRSAMTSNIDVITLQTKEQINAMKSAIALANAAREGFSTADIAWVVEQVEEVADAPCHLVYSPATENTIKFTVDDSLLESLQNHCDIRVPEVSNYTLLTTAELPENYQMEVINPDQIQKPLPIAEKIPSPAPTKLLVERTDPSTGKTESTALVEGTQKSVTVCHINNPSLFYVQLSSDKQKLHRLMQCLAKQGRYASMPTKLELDKLYMVQYKYDQKWYRGRVTSISVKSNDQKNSTTCGVFYLDYGNTESNVPLTRMKNLSIKWSTVPALAIKCALYDIVPSHGEWQLAANKAMKEMLDSTHRVEMHVMRVEPDICLVDICKYRSGDGDHVVSIRDALIFLEHGCFVTYQKLRKTNSNSLKDFFKEDVTPEMMYDIVVTHIDSPDSIYVQKWSEGADHFKKVKKEMVHEYGNLCLNKGIVYTPEIGMPCAVVGHDKNWYRGKIIGLPGNQRVEVFHVDTGRREVHHYDEIRRLSNRFMAITALAFKVSLKDIVPAEESDQWSVKSQIELEDLLAGKRAKMFVFSKDKASLKATMYVLLNDKNVNVNALLVQMGHARSTGLSSKMLEMPKVCGKKSGKKNVHRRSNPVDRCCTVSDAASEDDEVQLDPFKMQIEIHHVVSPDCIYVSDIHRKRQIQRMNESIQEFYNKYKSEESEEWTKDSICIAYSAKDRSYNRSKIVEIISSEQVLVFFCDVGITEAVSKQDLQVLHHKFAEVPTLVFKIKLGGILPCGDSTSWLSSSCKHLSDLIFDRHSSQFFISQMTGVENDAISVELWVEENKMDGPLSPIVVETKSINRMLVSNGYALPMKGFVDDTKKLLAAEFRQHLLNSSVKKDRWKTDKFVKKNTISCGSASDDRTSDTTTGQSTATDFAATSSDTEDSSTEDESVAQLAPTAWIPADPIEEDHFLAVGTYVDHDCVVYLHSVKQNSDTLNYIDGKLQKHFANSTPKPCDLLWEPRDICIAQYHGDNKWYRAQVLEVLENDEFKVIFVDYGNTENCKVANLRKRIITSHLPIQATKCVIRGLFPETANGKWPVSQLDTIHALLVQNQFSVTILERQAEHLEVSIQLPRFGNMDIKAYLIERLNHKFREIPVVSDESRSDKDSDNKDVVIEAYVKGRVSLSIEDQLRNMSNLKSDDSADAKKLSNNDEIVSGSFNCTWDAMDFEDSESNTSMISHSNYQSFTEPLLKLAQDYCDSSDYSSSLSQLESTIGYKEWDIPADTEIIRIKPTSPINATTFYASLHKTAKDTIPDSYADEFKCLTDEIQIDAPHLPKLENIQKGSSCTVQFVDGLWYRAVINEVMPESRTAEVYYVDYGNLEVLSFDDIHCSKPEWTKLTVMCLRFRLWKLQRAPDISMKFCAFKIDSVIFSRGILTAKIKNRSDDIIDVELYLDEGCTELCYDSLIDEGIYVQEIV